jgi:hypothetical protein
MSAVELFDKQELWAATGPFVITAIVILTFGLIGAILVVRMKKGLIKELMKVAFMLSLIFVAYITLQITAKIWGS